LKKISFIFAILEKDFIESMKNKTVLFSILFPVILSLVFSIVLRPKELSRLNLIIIDHGNSILSRTLREMGRKSSSLKIIESKDLETAKINLRNGESHAILVFPDKFDEQLEAGKSPKIDFWIGESGIKSAQILKSKLNQILYYCRYKKMPPDYFRDRSLFGKNYSPLASMLPTWVLFTVLGGYMVVSASIVEEKEKKTLAAILVTPCELPEILIGKGLLGVSLVTIGSVLILTLNKGFIGNVPLLLLIIVLGGTAFSALGVLVGLILPSQTSVSTFGSLMFLLMFMPVTMASVSEKMRFVAKLLPSYYIQTGMSDSMFAGVNFQNLAFHIGYLAVFTLVLLFAGVIVLNRKKE